MTFVVETESLARLHDVALLDLDGVVYRGENAVEHAASSVAAALAGGMRVAYVTNNAARTPSEVATHLRRFGLSVADADVVTSAQAAAQLLREHIPATSRVLAVGGAGVALALRDAGFEVVLPRDAAASPGLAAVVMGYGPDVSWRDLAEASYAVAAGAIFVATNTDGSIPTARGVAPGNGTLVGAVQVATGVAPQVAGKPHSPLMKQSVARMSAMSPLVVGDRLDTDIEAANRLGLPSLLVLTGVTDAKMLLAASASQRPTYLAADLRGLLRPGREILPDPSAAVLKEGGALQLQGEEDNEADPLRSLRASAAACWAAADNGTEPTYTKTDLTNLTNQIKQAQQTR